MIWRHGFDDWKPIEEVREIAQQVFRPPPLRWKPPLYPTAVPLPPSVRLRAPAVEAAGTAELKDLRPEPSGIGGWLILAGFAQVIVIWWLLFSIGKYYSKPEVPLFFAHFPLAASGEAAMNAATLALFVYTAVLFFRQSQEYPRFFLFQWIAVIYLPVVIKFWGFVTMSLYAGRPVSDFARIGPEDAGPMIAGAIGAAVWLGYLRRSRRVAHTFIR